MRLVMQVPNAYFKHRDTKAWVIQVWVSFGIAFVMCGVGLAYLPGSDLEAVFMVMGYVFSVTATIVLSKYVRDTDRNKHSAGHQDSPLFGAVVWLGFALALGLTAWGLSRMAINDTYKAFLGLGWLYLITSTFTLAKTLRDGHEADLTAASLLRPNEVDDASQSER
jgi:hypothetical protein